MSWIRQALLAGAASLAVGLPLMLPSAGRAADLVVGERAEPSLDPHFLFLSTYRRLR